MKTRISSFLLLVTVIIVTLSFKAPKADNPIPQYRVFAWNDLGMHCANKDFSKFVVLPPYNNLHSQVIRVGDATHLPEVITDSVTLAYSIPGNTYSVGKTNFWSYEDQLFGVNLPDNVGLTGEGLTGFLTNTENYYHVEGIPLTPFPDTDLVNEHPFQLGLVELYDYTNNLVASTQPVIPVSNEINCVSSGCHSSENQILNQHDTEGGFDPNNTPILCASCHSSNALGTPGLPGLGSLSEVIHDKHKDITNDCYKCHPGPNTQCQRGVMHEAGMVCQDCHGSLTNVAESIKNGREPWLEEPSCGSTNCHGSNFAEEPGLLFRQSKGHGNLYCSTCHGSPHAILPAVTFEDNVQNVASQGFEGTLQRCEVCHGVVPTMPGPHGIMPPMPITEVNIQVFLEGPFNGTSMNTFLNTMVVLPHLQPYNIAPWNYDGQESVSAIPNLNVVDWVFVELRETSRDSLTATSDKTVGRRAAFLLNDGHIVDLDGSSNLTFPIPAYVDLYAVVYHRNHLGVMSASPLNKNGNVYDYNFSTSFNAAFGGLAGYKEIATGLFGMVAGDADRDGMVSENDKLFWNSQSGKAAYLSADFNLNAQTDNEDKNEVYVNNLGTGSQINSMASTNAYKCQVPD